MTLLSLLITMLKAASVFALLAFTVKMLRRYDRRSGTAPRRNSRRGTARLGPRRSSRRPERILDVVERASLGRASSVVLVRVRDQHWVLGVTEQQVSMLLEVDLDEEEAIDLRPEPEEGATAAPSWGTLFSHLRTAHREHSDAARVGRPARLATRAGHPESIELIEPPGPTDGPRQ